MRLPPIITFGMNLILLFWICSCSTITYMRVSKPINIESILDNSTSKNVSDPVLIKLECDATVKSEMQVFCRNVASDIAKIESFKTIDSNEQNSAEYQINIQLNQLLEEGPSFWDYTFSFMTLSLYPQETRQLYEIRFVGHKIGSPNRIVRSMRCYTLRRFGGLYKLAILVSDSFRARELKEADVTAERKEASLDLFNFIHGSLKELIVLEGRQT